MRNMCNKVSGVIIGMWALLLMHSDGVSLNVTMVSMFDVVVNCVCSSPCKVFLAGFVKLITELEGISSCGLANDCCFIFVCNYQFVL